VLAGVGRVIIEFFRPDQPKIPELGISYSSVFAALMAIIGAVLLMARYKAINLKFAENWEEEYRVGEKVEAEDESDKPVEEKKAPRARKTSTIKANSASTKRTVKKTSARNTTKKTETSPRATRAKKSSQ